jgi:hypothetical protein
MFKIEIENHLNLAVVRKAAAGATKKGIADATAYLWKVTKNSIKKRDGRQKKYDLKMMGANGKFEETVQEHLSKEHNKDNITVIRDDKRDVRKPLLQNTYRQQKSAPAGSPPYSHKTKQKGWQDYWLRKGVQADFRQGLVYLNPSRIDKGYGRSKSIPQLIEEGGTGRVISTKLVGYYIFKRKYKNQKTKVSYSQIFSKRSWKYHFQSRPFMKLALKKSKEKILQIFQKALK